MFDPIAQGLAAVSVRSGYALPLVFMAGAVTSIGPCVAPRFIAVAGMAAGKTRRQTILLVLSFVAGLIATYASFGAVTSLLSRAVAFSTVTYAVVAIVLGAGGIAALWRGEDVCTHGHDARAERGGGGAFLLGASFALVVSPCCTPIVVGILAYTSAAGSVLYGTGLLACFALGHALPVLGVAFGMNGVSSVLGRFAVRQAATVVSATLMLGLAGYYALLA